MTHWCNPFKTLWLRPRIPSAGSCRRLPFTSDSPAACEGTPRRLPVIGAEIAAVKDANRPVFSDKELACRRLYGHPEAPPPTPSVFGRVEIPAPLGNGLGIMVSLEHGISLRLQQTLAHREPRRRCLEGKSGLSYSSRRKLPFQEGKPEGDRRCRPEGGMWEGGRRGSGGLSPHPSERSRWCRAGVITRRGGDGGGDKYPVSHRWPG